MKYELPATGCNVLENEHVIANYSTDGTTISRYVLQNGQLYLSSVETGESIISTGQCLHTGDLEWRPEYKIAAELVSIFVIAFIFWFLYHITLRRFIK